VSYIWNPCFILNKFYSFCKYFENKNLLFYLHIFLYPFFLYCILTVSKLSFFFDLYTIGRSPWMSDQPITKPLPKYRTTQTQNKRTHTPNIHALNRIRTNNHSLQVSKDSSCLSLLGYRDRWAKIYILNLLRNLLHNRQIYSDRFWATAWYSCSHEKEYTYNNWLIVGNRMFLMWSMPRCYEQDSLKQLNSVESWKSGCEENSCKSVAVNRRLCVL
jgi:hypothetical protein